MVYGDAPTTQRFAELVAEYPTIWEDNGFVDIPEDKWIKLELRIDWQ